MDIDKFIPGEYYWLLTNDAWKLAEYRGGHVFDKYYGSFYTITDPVERIPAERIVDTDIIPVNRPKEEKERHDKEIAKYRYVVGIRQYNTISEAIDEIESHGGGTIIVKERKPHKHHYKLHIYKDSYARTLTAVLECPCQEKNSFLKNDEIADYVNQLIDNQKE